MTDLTDLKESYNDEIKKSTDQERFYKLSSYLYAERIESRI